MLYLDIFIKTKTITPYIFTFSYLDVKLYGKSSIVISFYISSHKQARHPKALHKSFRILIIKEYLNKH